MSGGLAYILEEYQGEINPELVDIDPMEDQDFDTLHTYLKRHVAFTQSSLAQQFLEDWEQTKTKFIKVIPRDYKAVLAKKSLQHEKTVA
jgi:glutamate synthase (NADPH/NADH) large chain